jgi:hypothetical protein
MFANHMEKHLPVLMEKLRVTTADELAAVPYRALAEAFLSIVGPGGAFGLGQGE